MTMTRLKYSLFVKFLSAALPVYILAGAGLHSACASASTIGFEDISKTRVDFDGPVHAPPANPPIDTPAFYHGLVNAPAVMPESVPYHTLPGSGFGQAAVPVPAAVWLFGSGLLGLVGISRRRKAQTAKPRQP